MVNYEYGKIYKLYSKQQNITYYGSTAMYYLSQRLAIHRNNYKMYLNNKGNYVYSFKILECEDYKIELLEDYPCANKQQLETRERYYIENNECVNKNIPTRTISEWYEDNKDKLLLQNKEWYKNNKYYLNNKDKILVQNQEYRTNNKEKIKEYHKEYYKNNPEYYKEVITCECGCIINRSSLLRHTKTKKHIKLVQNKL